MNPDTQNAALADMQRRGMQNALAFGRATTGMFERLARQNYAVMGDVVDYTLSQLRIPTVHSDPRSALEAQAAGTRAAVEKARVRATEYAAIAGELRDVVGNVAGSATDATAAAAPAPTRSKSASAGKADEPAKAKAAGGSPIIVPDDAPKTVARKTARANAPAAKPAAAPAAKSAAKSASTSRPAAKKSTAKKAPARAKKG